MCNYPQRLNLRTVIQEGVLILRQVEGCKNLAQCPWTLYNIRISDFQFFFFSLFFGRD